MKSLLTRKALVSSLLAAGITSGALLAYGQTPATAPATTTSATTATQPSIPDYPLAMVNGKPISHNEFVAVLTDIAGMRLLEEYLNYYLAMDALASAGMKITEKDVQEVRDMVLARLGYPVPENQKDAVLLRLFASQGLVRPIQIKWALETRTALHMLAKGKITVTDEELKQAYDVNYGEKAYCRHIVVPDSFAAGKVREAVQSGKDPQELTGADIQVQPVMIAKADPNVLAKYKDAVFSPTLKEKSLTPMIPEGGETKLVHLFYLDKREAAKTDEPFDKVKDKLRTQLMDRKEAAWSQQHLMMLQKKADVKIFDPILVNQYNEAMNRIRAASTQTQPGTATAPATAPAATAPKP